MKKKNILHLSQICFTLMKESLGKQFAWFFFYELCFHFSWFVNLHVRWFRYCISQRKHGFTLMKKFSVFCVCDKHWIFGLFWTSLDLVWIHLTVLGVYAVLVCYFVGQWDFFLMFKLLYKRYWCEGGGFLSLINFCDVSWYFTSKT